MTTRSSVLWQSRIVGRPAGDLFTCPIDRTVILKSVLVHSQSSVAGLVSISVNAVGGGVSIPLIQQQFESGAFAEWNGWVVLEAGDYVYIIYDSGPIDSWGSGALLPVGPK